DGGIQVLGAVEVAADPVKLVALTRELVEGRLILRRSHTMASDPRARRPLLENAGELGSTGGGIAIHQHGVVAGRGPLIERRLIVRSGQSVAGLPDGRRGCFDPQCSVERCRASVAADVHQLHAMVANVVVERLLVLLRSKSMTGDPAADRDLRADVINVN